MELFISTYDDLIVKRQFYNYLFRTLKKDDIYALHSLPEKLQG